MSAELIAELILKLGVPLAQAVYNMATKPGGPTQDDWTALAALEANRANNKMLETLVANGIDPASDKGKALLALVQ